MNGTEQNVECIEPCASKCRGQVCCNCCGKAPAMHRRDSVDAFSVYSRECCRRTRSKKPNECVFLCGKTEAFGRTGKEDLNEK